MEKIVSIRDHLCTGCSACKNICPVSAIEMHLNETGFLVPQIEGTQCIECGKCDQVCPVLHQEDRVLPQCYAVWAKEETRLKSSSGGFFSVIAERILKENGVVFGAAWTKDFFVKHIFIESVSELDLLCRSKYAQSDLGDSYQQVKEFLNNGRKVLFVGTPCQVAGLDAFLGQTNRGNLLMIDFICYYNPPISYVRKYLNEKYGLEQLEEFTFRDKTYGWVSHPTKAVLKNGTVVTDKTMDSFFQGYFNALYAREACTKCTFSGGNHHSDMTIGDFWKIESHDASWNDGKGTSMVIIRTRGALRYFEKMKTDFERSERVPMEWIREGQNNCKKAHPGKAYFDELVTYKCFDEAVEKALEHKYDIGLVCVQSYQNYGSAFTNYALYCVLKDLKYSVLIITQPLSSDIKPVQNDNFRRTPYKEYENAKHYVTKEEMQELNNFCSVFLVGSDQLFNYEIYRKIDGFIKLDWVDDEHKKISYATSFGQDRILGTLEESIEFKKSLSRFSNISVREESGVELFRNNFKIDAKQVLDPVFLCDVSHYTEMCDELENMYGKIFAYILDPDMEKANALKKLSLDLEKEIVALVDRWMGKEYVESHWDIPTQLAQKNEVWLKMIMDSEFVFTDSFHGMCFAIIFEKQFAVINNKNRGSTRFMALLEKLNLTDRIFETAGDFIRDFDRSRKIDYEKVNAILAKEKERSMEWLIGAIRE